MPSQFQHVGRLTVHPPGAGLIDGDSAYRAPVAPCLDLLNVVDQHPPQTSIGLLQLIGYPIDGHLGTQVDSCLRVCPIRWTMFLARSFFKS